MNIVYNKINGIIEGVLDDKVNYKIYYSLFPQEFQDSLECFKLDDVPRDISNYTVVGGKLLRKSENDIFEVQHYGKILTEEERLNILLMPSEQEIQKAQTTIEILSLLQEVNII